MSSRTRSTHASMAAPHSSMTPGPQGLAAPRTARRRRRTAATPQTLAASGVWGRGLGREESAQTRDVGRVYNYFSS